MSRLLFKIIFGGACAALIALGVYVYMVVPVKSVHAQTSQVSYYYNATVATSTDGKPQQNVASGCYTWTAPSDVTQANIWMWSSGGNGGGLQPNGNAGNGGGGSGFVAVTVPIVPNKTYSIHVAQPHTKNVVNCASGSTLAYQSSFSSGDGTVFILAPQGNNGGSGGGIGGGSSGGFITTGATTVWATLAGGNGGSGKSGGGSSGECQSGGGGGGGGGGLGGAGETSFNPGQPGQGSASWGGGQGGDGFSWGNAPGGGGGGDCGNSEYNEIGGGGKIILTYTTTSGGGGGGTQYLDVLRIRTSSGTVHIAGLADETQSALRIEKNGAAYAVMLVPITDPNASPVRIMTAAGVKALRTCTSSNGCTVLP